ncbi:MAG: metal ABC transporter substrate-binding protein [Lachnospiraceae bacterium]|nr:metal ABC transporter substrate-binding protein [Lachnospiraceae bacterium]
MKKNDMKCRTLRGRLSILFMVTLVISVLSGCGRSDDKNVASTALPGAQDAGGQTAQTAQTSDGQTAQTSDGQTAQAETSSGDAATGDKYLSVVASPGIHTEILKMAQTILAGEGITLYIDSDFEDYLIPNFLVDGGVYTCNYFQHEEYLNSFNEEQGTDLVSVGKIHFEPLGIYPGKKKSLKSLESGDVITIPRDTANQARALKLLSDAGLIKLPADKTTDASIGDITDNPYGIKVQLMDASQVPSAIADSAFIVMNGNYARQALYTVTSDAIAYENPDSSVADKYANIIAVNRGDENNPLVQELVKVLQSEDIRVYMQSRFAGAVVPYSGS